jgi:hypothetical protein
MKIDKALLLDSRGRPITQSMFLEIGYTDFAVFTTKDNDYTYKGKVYPSLKKLYLEYEDPTEYAFVQEYLSGWSQWKQLCNNQQTLKFINEWREELELKLRSQAIRDMIDQSADGGSFQASKWLADRGWDKRAAGRPSKQEQQKEQRVKEKISNEFNDDAARLNLQ